MTDALCKLGPKAEIETLHGGGLRRLRVDWEECLRGGHFPYLAEGKPRRSGEITLVDGISSPSGTRVRIHGQAPGVHVEKLLRLLTERYTPGIWQGREIFVRREAREPQDWLTVEDMDPGPLDDVIEYDGEISVSLNPDDARIRALRERRDCPGLVHVITAYVAQYAALGDENARRVLRPGIVRDADPGLREHELYAYYYDRVDQPAVAHENEAE
jgi:hypothetical protein